MKRKIPGCEGLSHVVKCSAVCLYRLSLGSGINLGCYTAKRAVCYTDRRSPGELRLIHRADSGYWEPQTFFCL